MDERAVGIQLDKPRKLRYTFNSVADLEEKAGTGIGALMSEEKIGFYTVRLLTWAGLKWQDKGLTLERTGNMIQTYFDNGGDFVTLMNFITVALQLSGILGKPTEEAVEEIDEGNQKAKALN